MSMTPEETDAPKPTHWCSFCGLGNVDSEVKHIVVGNDVAICDICIELCRDVIGEQRISKGRN